MTLGTTPTDSGTTKSFQPYPRRVPVPRGFPVEEEAQSEEEAHSEQEVAARAPAEVAARAEVAPTEQATRSDAPAALDPAKGLTEAAPPAEPETAPPAEPEVASDARTEGRREMRAARRRRRRISIGCAVLIAACTAVTLLVVAIARDRSPNPLVVNPPGAIITSSSARYPAAVPDHLSIETLGAPAPPGGHP